MDPAASAFVARMDVEPDAARQALIDELFIALRNGAVSGSNLLTKQDALWILAGHDIQANRLNLISSDFTLTEVEAGTWTIDRGWAGDGATAYLDTHFNPTTAMLPQYQQSDAHFGYWSRTSAQSSAKGDMGAGAAACANSRTADDTALWALNRPLDEIVANADGSGHFVYVRGPGNSDNLAYRNGVPLGIGDTSLSTGVPSADFAIGAQSAAAPTVFSTRELAAAHIGGLLNADEVLDLYNAIDTYLGKVEMTEPVTVAQAKAQLGIEASWTDDDTIITGYIVAARELVEELSDGVILVPTTISKYYDEFGDFITLYKRPIAADAEVTISYIDEGEADATYEGGLLRLARVPARVYPASGSPWPSLSPNGGVTVSYPAGYASAADIPQRYIQAIMLLVAHFYRNRMPVSTASNVPEELQFTVTALINKQPVI
jgi:uncharacterized phiE125 gp8 family phage protein